jgi:hypothetical protein
MCVNNLSDAVARESFLSEASLDVIEYFSVRGVRFVQNIPEVVVCGTQAVAKMLSKNTTAI